MAEKTNYKPQGVKIGIQFEDEAEPEIKNVASYWLNIMERVPTLEPLGKFFLRILCCQLSSSFSESIFSFGGNTSSGNQSRCGPLRLNARMFIRFNYEILEEMFESRIHELTCGKKRESVARSVAGLFKKVNDTTVATGGEDVVEDNDSESSLSGFYRTPCPICNCFEFELVTYTEKMKEDKVDVTCDCLQCTHRGLLKVKMEFFACKHCDNYDVCLTCARSYF